MNATTSTAELTPTEALSDPDRIRAALDAGDDTVTKIVRRLTGGRHGSHYNRLVERTAAAAGILLPAAVHAQHRPKPTAGRVPEPPAPDPLGRPSKAHPVGATFTVPEPTGQPLPTRGLLADYDAVRTAIDGAVSLGQILVRLGYKNSDDSKTIASLKNLCAHHRWALPANESFASPTSRIDALDRDQLALAASQPDPYRALTYIGLAHEGGAVRRLTGRLEAAGISPSWA